MLENVLLHTLQTARNSPSPNQDYINGAERGLAAYHVLKSGKVKPKNAKGSIAGDTVRLPHRPEPQPIRTLHAYV